MFAISQSAVEGALAAGAAYADARVVLSKQQSLACLNGNLEALDYDERAGVGVRALIGSSWGFFATPELTEQAALAAGAEAAAIATASAMAPGPALHLTDVPVVEAH